jgi:endonuclease/exonuclease/phosphatase (EEP) superfamily protein YafD
MSGLVWRVLRRLAVTALVPVSGGALVASVLAFFGSRSELIDLLTHFRMHYAVAGAAVTVLALALRSRELAALSLVTAILNLALIAPLFVPPEPGREVRTEPGPPLHLLQFNVLTANRARDTVAGFINRSGADVAVLEEVDQEWLDALAQGAPAYRRLIAVPRGDNFGMAVLGRRDADELVVGSTAVHHLGSTVGAAEDSDEPGRPAIEVHLRWAGRPLALLAVHTMPPTSLGHAALRDRQLTAAGHWAAGQDGPTVVIGDLNATPWSHGFKLIVGTGHLLSSQRGFGYQGTWRAEWPALLQIPIDHCLHSRHVVSVAREIGPAGLGSDHRPLLAALRWRD